MTMLSYKTALITGASSGLGRGLAAWFARQGVTVYAAARRIEALESLRNEVGDLIQPLALDVSNADAAHARIAALDDECGGLDLVVANAGLGLQTNGKRVVWSSVKRIVETNVTGALATLCAPLPAMVRRQRGHLVGVSSLAGLIPAARLSTYGASKTFLSMWLESLRLDLAGSGVAVTTLQPGYVKSEMTAQNKPGSMPFVLETDDAVQRMGKAIVRQAAVFSFPWQVSASISVANWLPRSVRAKMVRGISS
jgi:short-subunit dehydrogenase